MSLTHHRPLFSFTHQLVGDIVRVRYVASLVDNQKVRIIV